MLEYDWRALIFDRKIKSVSIDGGDAVIAFNESGAIDIAGWSPDPNAKRAPPPFKKLDVNNLALVARTPEGDARFEVDGAFDYADGGEFDLALSGDKAGFDPITLADPSGQLKARLGADGAVGVSGGVRGAIATSVGVVRGLDADIDARLSSWRGIFGEGSPALEGEATIALKSSTLDAGATSSLAAITAGGATPIKTLSLAGVIKASIAQGGYALTLGEDPLVISADRGDSLAIFASDTPLFESRGGVRRLSLKALLEGPVAKGDATFSAQSEKNGPWRIDAAATLGEQTIGGVSLGRFAGSFNGVFSERLTGEADVVALVRKATIGRLRINDMPAAGRVSLILDLEAKSLSASPAEGACIAIGRASFQMAEQDMDAGVADASLCASEGPLVAVNWNEKTTAHVEGALSAREARYRLGKTLFDGAPPRVDFALDYEPAVQTSRIVGNVAGGRFLLNKAFVLSEAKGSFEGDIVREKMSVKAILASMKIAQNAKEELVAPVHVAGVATLADNVSRFDFSVTTPKGRPLGRGEGAHRVKTGEGEAVFDSGLVTFALGLQPDRLIPALRGVISNATGTTEGGARFTWTPKGVVSTASVNFDNVSFAGPGVAVTRTEGVTGKMAFSSLSPVATDGEQTLSIRKIDLDALKLENGAMRFALPGDGTLKIVEAEFPWFGGTIGAYGSEMQIAGGKAETTLQIDNVNLAELLKYINVEGLSGDGVIEGVLPIVFEGGKASINNGILSSKGHGVIRYESNATNAASQSNEQSALAFEILRELRFDKLAATIDGPLDGTLDFNVLFEGRSDIPVKTGDKTQRIDSPSNTG